MPSGTRRMESGFTFIEFLFVLTVVIAIVLFWVWVASQDPSATHTESPVLTTPAPTYQVQLAGGGSYSVWTNGTALVRCEDEAQCVEAIEGFLSAFRHCDIVGVGPSWMALERHSGPTGYFFIVRPRDP